MTVVSGIKLSTLRPDDTTLTVQDLEFGLECGVGQEGIVGVDVVDGEADGAQRLRELDMRQEGEPEVRGYRIRRQPPVACLTSARVSDCSSDPCTSCLNQLRNTVRKKRITPSNMLHLNVSTCHICPETGNRFDFLEPDHFWLGELHVTWDLLGRIFSRSVFP